MEEIVYSPSGKPIMPLCTKAGNFPHNKGGVLVQVDPERIVDQYPYKGGKLVVLRPIIDKLVFEYNFRDCGSNKQKIQNSTSRKASKLLKDGSVPLSMATKENVGWERLYHLNRNYSRSYVLVYQPTGAKIIIQLGPRKKNIAYMRCDLNPARLGAAGMTFFREFLNKLFANKLKNITFATIAKQRKGVKRIDIAVDMLGVDASDLEGRYTYKDKKLKMKKVENHTGRVETMYFDMPENDKNQAYWYNKRQAYKDNAKDPVDGGQQSPYGQALYTRFEYRIQETEKPIANLKSFHNHLEKVRFRAVDYSRAEGKDYMHMLFLRYALSRTRDKALAMIPDDLQAEYGSSYDDAIVNIWNAEKIWEKGWHKELLYLGLTTHAELKKMKKVKKK